MFVVNKAGLQILERWVLAWGAVLLTCGAIEGACEHSTHSSGLLTIWLEDSHSAWKECAGWPGQSQRLLYQSVTCYRMFMKAMQDQPVCEALTMAFIPDPHCSFGGLFPLLTGSLRS